MTVKELIENLQKRVSEDQDIEDLPVEIEVLNNNGEWIREKANLIARMTRYGVESIIIGE